MPWPKGKSPHPGGRRSEKPFFTALSLEINDAADDRPRLRAIAAKVLALAEAGDMRAIEFLADRLDGKPKQSLDIDATVTHQDPKERFQRIIELQAHVIGQEQASAPRQPDPPAEPPKLLRIGDG
jgi:cell division protein FtsN